MSKMGVMPTVIERKNDPPPNPQHHKKQFQSQSIQTKFFPFSLENLSTLSIFICEIVVDDVYVKLNETSPMLL